MKYFRIVTNRRAKPQQSSSVEKHAHHQGWFTALYTQHLLDLQSFEFEICILQALKMPLMRCTNVFFQGRLSLPLPPTPRRLVSSLGLGTTWVRQLRSGSYHYPTAATKCNEQPSQATADPVGGKACSVYCAIYSTFTLFTKLRV